MRTKRRQKHNAAASTEGRQQLLNEKVGCADVDRIQLVEVFDGHVFERDCLPNSDAGDQNIKLLSEQILNLQSKIVRAIRSCEVGGNSVCAPARQTNLVGDNFCLTCSAATMNDDVGTG